MIWEIKGHLLQHADRSVNAHTHTHAHACTHTHTHCGSIKAGTTMLSYADANDCLTAFYPSGSGRHRPGRQEARWQAAARLPVRPTCLCCSQLGVRACVTSCMHGLSYQNPTPSRRERAGPETRPPLARPLSSNLSGCYGSAEMGI